MFIEILHGLEFLAQWGNVSFYILALALSFSMAADFYSVARVMCLVRTRTTCICTLYVYACDERGRITRYNAARWRRKEQGPKYMHKACPNKSLSVSLGRKKQMVSLWIHRPDAARSHSAYIRGARVLSVVPRSSARDELIVSVRVLGFFIGHPLAQLQPLSPTFAFNWPVLFALARMLLPRREWTLWIKELYSHMKIGTDKRHKCSANKYCSMVRQEKNILNIFKRQPFTTNLTLSVIIIFR